MFAIFLNPKMSNVLAEYLNRKYMERLAKEGRGYSLRAFAGELGINERTLARMMDETINMKGVQLANMQKIARVYKADFLRAMGLL